MRDPLRGTLSGGPHYRPPQIFSGSICKVEGRTERRSTDVPKREKQGRTRTSLLEEEETELRDEEDPAEVFHQNITREF